MSALTNKLKKRRSYRAYEVESFDINILIDAIEAAKHAPNGANKQPWSFCIIKDPLMKKAIRHKSEEIEALFYKRISKDWQEDLVNLRVNTNKAFLEEAPYLVVIFKHTFQYDKAGNHTKVYYADASVGIATGILISALTDYGIDILTYTPAPNSFLKDILKRPDNEKPFLILVCGKGSKHYKLPNITKKTNKETIFIY